MENKQKRQDRSVSQETKSKISASLKRYNQGHPRSEEYRKKLSDGNKRAWAKIPQKKTEIEDLI